MKNFIFILSLVSTSAWAEPITANHSCKLSVVTGAGSYQQEIANICGPSERFYYQTAGFAGINPGHLLTVSCTKGTDGMTLVEIRNMKFVFDETPPARGISQAGVKTIAGLYLKLIPENDADITLDCR